ncbi:hypothetical protein [Candidatus Poriferisocius sp.]|uniref:hypothetical protein n=1 Tax=Candidatus Poriferisocius sp. TaxID=3101276 RepID=UPI003B026445
MFRRDDESGLTTLEWLLIVAAVAGLAALAVVLVQNVVDSTAEQISSSSARETAARVAAADVEQQAYTAAEALTADTDEAMANALSQVNLKYERLCNRLGITYNNVPGISFAWKDGLNSTGSGDTEAKKAASRKAKFLDKNTGRAPTCTVGS